MARGHKRQSTPERDTSRIANGFDVVPAPAPPVVIRPLRGRYTEIEDNRNFHPERARRPLKSKTGAPVKLRLSDTKKRYRSTRWTALFGNSLHSQTKAKISFNQPQSVLVCVRRQRRKEVLIAKRKKGRGGSRRTNWWSYVKC